MQFAHGIWPPVPVRPCIPRRDWRLSIKAQIKVDAWSFKAAFGMNGMQLCSPMVVLVFDGTVDL